MPNQKTRPDDSFQNFPVNTDMSPAHGDLLSYSTGTQQWTNGAGISTGTLDARYLKLDASNDPLTGTLTITPPIGNQGISITTENTGISEFISQQGVSGSAFVPATLYLQRRTVDTSAPLFNSPIIQIEKLNLSGTFQNGILDYTSNLVSRVAINPDAQGTGTLVYFDGDFQLSSNGLLLLLKNNGTSEFYVNASGTAHSNGVPLIKEAPANGSFYGRKNSGWETVIPSNGWTPQLSTWIRTGNHTLIVSGNQTGTYQKGTKLWWTDNGVGNKYGVVGSYTFTSGTITTVNLIPNTDYIASGTIANPYISYIENPEGFPGWFTYAATVSGSGGSAGTYAEDFVVQQYETHGNTLHVVITKRITNKGSWSGDVLVLRPFTASAAGSLVIVSGGMFALGSTTIKSFLNGGSTTYFRFTLDGSLWQWSSVSTNDLISIETSYKF